MSSVSSFICLSSNVSNTSQSDFSFIENPSHKPLQFDASAIQINENQNEIGTIISTDDFEHLSQNDCRQDTENSTDNEHDEWSCISDNNFDIRSINTTKSSIQSIDTVKNFIFGDYKFKTTGEKTDNSSSSKWVWTGNQRCRKYKHRRKKNRLEMIAENDELMAPEIISKTGLETAENKTVINIGDLNDFINDTIQINDNINSIINLCNKICKTGLITVNNMELQICDIPLIGLKLRDIFFRKLVLLNESKSNNLNIFEIRRQYWLRLNWYARVYLTPFGSFEEFRNLYNVHISVSSVEFLSVIDNESFDILMKPEWIRVCLFKSYVMKIRNMNMIKRMEIEREKMDEINTLCSIGNFCNDEMVNIERFKHKQLSFIMSDNYSRYDSEFNDSFQAFDALERDIQFKLRMECQQMDRFTNQS